MSVDANEPREALLLIAVGLSTILKDHLGSTDLILTSIWNGSTFANPQTERQSFNPWGERRAADTQVTYRATDSDPFRTSAQDYDRGYTGHEQLDDSGLIHMNGRIYDPELGRMLSPDPVVQVPEYSQNFNRYSYVMNNPLNLTDPTGFSWLSNAFHKLGSWIKENWRTVVVIVVVAVLSYFTAGAASAWGSALYSSATGAAVGGSAATAAGFAVSGAYIGAVSGGLGAALNGGDLGDVLRGAAIGAVQGAITGGMLHGMGEAANSAGFFSQETALHIAGHGVVGGSANAAMGGKFQDGFISAAVSAGASDAGFLGDPTATGPGAVASRTIKAGIVGGTASALGGGKFSNGAYTAAFQHLLNAEAGRRPALETVDANDDGGPDPRMENAFARNLPLGKSSFLMIDYWGTFQSSETGRYGLATIFDKNGTVVGSWEFNNGGSAGAVMIKEGTYTLEKHWSAPPNFDTGHPEGGRYPNSGNGPAYWRDGYSFKIHVVGPSATPGILFHPDGSGRGTQGCFGIAANRPGLEMFERNIRARYPMKMYTPPDP